MKDLIPHEGARDISSPSQALTIARDVLQTRRRIIAQAPDWALGPNGLLGLRQAWTAASPGSGILADSKSTAVSDAAVYWQDWDGEGRKNRWDDGVDLPGIDLHAIDAVQARSEDVLAKAKQPQRLPSRRQTR